MSETTQSPPPAEAPPAKFEDFMSDQIKTSLKENPHIPSLNKDAIFQRPPAPELPPHTVPDPGHGSKLPETTPEQSAKALLPDFSKLAFGQTVEKVAQEKSPPEEAPKEPLKETLKHEDFPEKFPGAATPQAEATWAKMRTSVQSLWKQNADLTGRLKDTEAKLKEFDGKTPMAADEYEKLTGERDTLAKELKLTKLEATPEYQRAVAKPMQMIEDEVKRMATKYGVSTARVREALIEPDRDKQSEFLSKVTDTFNDRDKMGLFKLSDDAREILRRRSVLQQDVKQALDYIEAKRAAEAERLKTEKANEWTGAQRKAWKSIGDELYLARPVEGNDEWNKSLEETRDLVARTDFSALDPVDQAKVMVQAALLPRTLIVIRQLWDMYQSSVSALKRYQGVTPGAGGGSSSGGEPNGQSAVPSEMSFIDAIEKKIHGVRH